ncbi:MAG: GIY-YIG nuclease family protein [bacterium]|nr:GIY-YIG nuclease family protein [bacterium]
MVFCVCVLESAADSKRYVGSTNNLKRRLAEHQDGLVFSTKYRKPLKLVYFEGCTEERDARRREQYLKSTKGRRFLAKRLMEYYRKKQKLIGTIGTL